MTAKIEPSNPSPSTRSRRRRTGWTIRISPAGVLLLVIINLLILGGLAYGIIRLMNWYNFTGQLNSATASETSSAVTTTSVVASVTSTSQPTASPTLQPTVTSTTESATVSPQPISTLTFTQGLIILAMDEGGNTHLFAYQPADNGEAQPLPLTRLTNGPWDDINPAFSPDGQTVAFASNRSGYWDIYLLDLNSGGITRLTDTLEYEGAPSWSPDNKWLVYESYTNENLEIEIQSVNPAEDSILLTNDPAADFSPAWSPDGRKIVFVSNRGGEDEIWLADLDKVEDQRFQNISQNPSSADTHPAWSPDGKSLVWVGEQDGMRNLFLQELQTPGDATATPIPLVLKNLGSGDWPVWSPDGETILTILEAPNRTYLTAYHARYPGLVLPALELPFPVNGLSWGRISLTPSMQSIYQAAYQLTPTPLYLAALSLPPDNNGGRYQLVQLPGIDAPHPYLHDMTDESFQALRQRIATEVGWDFLSSLENAYVPLTSPLEPGMGNDWLYTGRAFSINPLPMNSGWLVVIREDFGSDTYWRLYVRALYQDGSVGIPLHDLPWSFESRNSGDTTAYEQGGEVEAFTPSGYWVDFTEHALSYGWERLPALSTWRASYQATRFNELAFINGTDWESAMLELYPPEAMITPSPVVPPTRTLTPTPWWYVSPTPTATPTPRPTFTPSQATPTSFPVPGG